MSRVTPLAAFVALGLLAAACAPAQPSPTAPPAKPAATTPPGAKPPEGKPAAAGNPDTGKQLFISQGCGGCHTIQGLAGASGQVGPDQTHVATIAATRVPGTSAEAYLKQAIQDPDTYTVQGFQKGVMPKLPLSEAQVNDLVAYLITLK